MDNEFLEDYDQEEREQQQRFANRVANGLLNPKERFPPLDRFPKISEPYASSCPGKSIWPQIPLFSSFIVKIVPRMSSQFEFAHGFSPSEIQKLVDYHKDTGKIQFALAAYPNSFSGLDYLDPILELRPPVMAGTSVGLSMNDVAYRKSMTEFLTLAGIRFYSHLMSRAEGTPSSYVLSKMPEYAKDYAFLKTRGFAEIASVIEENLVEDPGIALDFLQLSARLIVWPHLDYLKAIPVFSRETLARAVEYGKQSFAEQVSMPYEIGSFLIKQLTFQPESFEACMELVSRFDHRDLRTVMSAICSGAVKKDREILNNSVDKLNEIFDLVWQDAAKVAAKANLAKFLIPVSLGAVGTIINPSLGLLGALGFAVVERISEVTEQSISERVARSISPGYAFTLYDFQKKYRVADKRPVN